jgi:hypothetical protein
MPPHQEDQFKYQPLFRSEQLSAARDAHIAESKITRPWAVSAIALTCLPLLAILLTISFTLSFRQPQYVDGIIGDQHRTTCGRDKSGELVGIVEIDEVRLAQVREDLNLLVLVPAVSDVPATAKVVCISNNATSLGTKTEPAKYGVVLALSALDRHTLSQKVRSGMTIRAQIGYTDIRLLTLFTKDRDNAH